MFNPWYPELSDPLVAPEATPTPADWPHRPEVIAEHLEGLKRVLTMPIPGPREAKGEGLLYVGGGPYWPGIVIGIRLLREMGSNLPVQVWHRGDLEPVDLDLLQGLSGVTVVDSVRFARQIGGCRILRGWEQKLLALTHCGWERVIYLDADAYLVERPEPLLDQLERAPFVFWQDMAHNEGTVKWDKVWPGGPNGVPPVQGGQLVIDRVEAWRVVLAAHWMNQHSDFYYAHMFGDQDTWRVILAAVNNPRGWLNLGKAPWQSTAFLCGLDDGRVRVIHRCQGKLMRLEEIPKGRRGYNSPQWTFPKEKRVFQILTEINRVSQKTPEEVFGTIYSRDLWAGGAGSGTGSLGHEATAYLSLINTLLRFEGAKSVLDLGCGDGAIGRRIQVEDYLGVDCHRPHIERLQGLNTPGKQWLHLDFFRDRSYLPSADVVLVKDVLHHWPNDWVISFLRWLREEIQSGRYRRAFLVQDLQQVEDGQDTHLGGYRALDPAQYPLKEFSLATVVPYHHKACLMME